MMKFTEESVKQLSPDDSSTKAGLQLATLAKWENLHAHPQALWGECRGSGKNPYFTQIDLGNIAFKCTCPSRKFPCKHGLGLLFLYVKQNQSFLEESKLHDKVAEWLEKREERTTAKVQKEQKPVDEAAQLKRNAQRELKVEEGLAELDLWMKDVVRTGIQSIPRNQYSFFQNIIPRMVDAQAVGIAASLRSLSEINYFATEWEELFMKQFSKIYFILQTYRNYERLSPAWQQEIRSAIGWITNKDDLTGMTETEDLWTILHTEKTQQDKLIAEKSWMKGKKSGIICYQLQFYTPQQAFANTILVPGSVINAKVVSYPSVGGSRIRITESTPSDANITFQSNVSSFEELLIWVSKSKTENPLSDEFPTLISGIRLVFYEQRWYLTDLQQKSIQVKQTELALYKIWALTQSAPFSLFAIYQDGALCIKSFIFNEKFYSL